MADLDYVQSGQNIKSVVTSSSWNALVDAARQVRAGRIWSGAESESWGELRRPFCKLATTCASGTFAAPAATTVDLWVPNMSSGSSPRPLVITPDSWGLGAAATNYFTLESVAPIGTPGQLEWGPDGWYFIWLDWC